MIRQTGACSSAMPCIIDHSAGHVRTSSSHSVVCPQCARPNASMFAASAALAGQSSRQGQCGMMQRSIDRQSMFVAGRDGSSIRRCPDAPVLSNSALAQTGSSGRRSRRRSASAQQWGHPAQSRNVRAGSRCQSASNSSVSRARTTAMVTSSGSLARVCDDGNFGTASTASRTGMSASPARSTCSAISSRASGLTVLIDARLKPAATARQRNTFHSVLISSKRGSHTFLAASETQPMRTNGGRIGGRIAACSDI